MKLVGISILFVALAALGPVASAESDTTWALSEAYNVAPLGTHSLTDAGTGTSQPLPACWANAIPLAAGASFHDHVESFTLYLTSSIAGTVTVTLTAFDAAGNPTPLADTAVTAPVEHMGRAVIPPTLVLPTTDVDRVDIGVVHAEKTVSGTWPVGSYRGFCVESSGVQSVYTSASVLNSAGASSATIPLPELPAALLFGMGGLLVAGVVFARRSK